MEEKLTKKLNSKIEAGETLLWSGRPEAFEFMDKTHAGPIKKKFAMTLAIGLAIIIGYLILAVQQHAGVKLPAIIILSLFVVYILADASLEAKKLKNKVMYGLTNHRMLIVVGEVVFSVEYEAIKDYKLITDEDGHTSLVCGEVALSQPDHTRRTSTVIGTTLNQNTGICDSFAMYALPEVAPVQKILAEHIAA